MGETDMLIKPLPQGFGVEISEFDLHDGRAPQDIARLARAFRDDHLIVFRSPTTIAPERQVEVTGWFGPILREGTDWTVLDNADPTGRFVLPFHCDITFVEHPLAGISLCPQELPDGPTSTTYISNAGGWRRLPERLRHELAGRTARHSFISDADIDLGMPEFEYWHPARMPHPETGEPLLLLTEGHVDLIEGLSPQRSADILQEAFATLYVPEYRYEHVWREGDLVVWNNLAIQHARTQVAEVSRGKRIVRRVQLGTVGFREQVAQLQEQKAHSLA
jgi:taurine dioxygenase